MTKRDFSTSKSNLSDVKFFISFVFCSVVVFQRPMSGGKAEFRSSANFTVHKLAQQFIDSMTTILITFIK